MSSQHAPDVGGYALGILVSGLVILVPSLALGPYVLYVAFVLLVAALPIGVVGAALTHVACRDAPHQGAHVLVAGLCGFTLTFLLVAWAEGDDLGPVLLLPAIVGAAAAIGRASAIPQVRRRAEAVDHDFRPAA